MNKYYYFNVCTKIFYLFIFIFMLLNISNLMANLIEVNNSNYTNYLNVLVAGDTLYLKQGIYNNNLKLNGLNGTPLEPIVIIGEANKTIFIGQSFKNYAEGVLFFENSKLCAEYISKNQFQNALILLKVSRGVKLEIVIRVA